MGPYQELRMLTLQGICGKSPETASAFLAHERPEYLEAEASRSLDLGLLEVAKSTDSPLPLLCLRCRLSHPLEAWLKATFNAHHERHGIELKAMASYALDDEGVLIIRRSKESTANFTYSVISSLPKGPTSPFSAEILRSFDPALCGLPHWARLKIQSNNELKAYFKQHGLLLISDWALLRNSSPRRVQEACQAHLRSSATIESLIALHSGFKPLYDLAKQEFKALTGKSSGWQPGLEFLQQLDPAQEPFNTKERLLAIAKAIRQLLTGSANQSLDQSLEAGYEPVTPSSASSDGPEPTALKVLIDAALERAMDNLLPAVMQKEAIKFSKDEGRKLAFELYGQGLSQRDIAQQVKHEQPWVSKLLDEKRRSTEIAIAAAIELKRQPEFISCGKSVEAAERLVNALRNHLVEPELEGDIPPLRRWVQQYINQL
ncbi:hypothetical protein [Synechococcus sp. UW140]|uniref:hypothetical protein n=1 Tax=Synechococcus sp. UW140 TaxID=368503 RepID=UPI003137DCDD